MFSIRAKWFQRVDRRITTILFPNVSIFVNNELVHKCLPHYFDFTQLNRNKFLFLPYLLLFLSVRTKSNIFIR